MGILWLLGAVALVAALSDDSDESESDTESPPAAPPDKAAGKPKSAKQAAHVEGFRKAMKAFAEKTKAAALESAQLEKEQEQSGKVAAAATSAIGAAAAYVPVIGQILAVFAQLLALMFKTIGYGAFIPRTDTGLFTGWRDDCYYFREVPIYGPAIEQLRDKIAPLVVKGAEVQLDALVTLCKALPSGPPVPEVSIYDTGDYEYRFNFDSPGDLSESAKAAEKIRRMQVYSPADITPKGPRGFDPQNPWAWKVPGERASVYDRAVRLAPGDFGV